MSVSGDGRVPVSRNDVTLVGRLGGAPARRPLPSGDVLVAWRLIVDRTARPPGARRVVDTLPCVTFERDVCRETERWQIGDTLEVRGAVRRRFWRTASGAVSRYEIEVTHARRIAGVATLGAPSPGGEGTKHEPGARLGAE